MTNADQKLRQKKVECIAPIRPEGRNLVIPVACGRCIPCRIRKRQEWTTRIMLESLCHQSSIFLTLTYDDDHLPGIDQYPHGNLQKKDAVSFQKLLRQEIKRYENKLPFNPKTEVRFYTVGEYGEETERAHMHAVVFGFPYEYEFLIHKAWKHGFTYVRPLLRERAAYVAGYTTKKLARDERLLDGRNPVFQLSSRRPGLGQEFAKEIARTITSYPHKRNIVSDGCIRIDGRLYRLPKYIEREIDRECFRLTGEYISYIATEQEDTFELSEVLDRRRVTEIRIKQMERKNKNAERKMRYQYGKGT